MALRSFIIKNRLGQSLNLMDKTTFGSAPTGLGYEMDTTYNQAYNTFLADQIIPKQTDLTYTVLYGYVSKTPYMDFNHAVQILNYPPLTLEYMVPDVGIYQRDVEFKSIDKTEIDHTTDLLSSVLTLSPLTPWYEWVQLTDNLGGGQDVASPGKIVASENTDGNSFYATYPYTYASSEVVLTNTVVIDNDSVYLGSQSNSALRVTIKPNASYPTITTPLKWTLLDEDGKIVATEKFTQSFGMGDYVVVNTDYSNRGAFRYTAEGTVVTDITNAMDPTVSGFVRVPIGHYTLRLSDELYAQTGGFASGVIKVEYKKELVVV